MPSCHKWIVNFRIGELFWSKGALVGPIPRSQQWPDELGSNYQTTYCPVVSKVYFSWTSQCFWEKNNHMSQCTGCSFLLTPSLFLQLKSFWMALVYLSLELSPGLIRVHPISSSRLKALNSTKDIERYLHWPLRNSSNWQYKNNLPLYYVSENSPRFSPMWWSPYLKP